MTDEPVELEDEHTPTAAEDALYEAMSAGNWDAVDEARADAYEDGAGEQFEADHAAAHARYQADHETSEQDRIEQTAETVETENTEAPDG